MLISFSVKNFKSIKEKATLDLTSKTRINENYRENFHVSNNIRTMNSLAIFGSNASGKSNIIQALSYISNIITTGELPLKIDSFFYNPDPIEFEIEFLVNSKIFKYIIHISGQGFVREILSYKKASSISEFTQIFNIGLDYKESPPSLNSQIIYKNFDLKAMSIDKCSLKLLAFYAGDKVQEAYDFFEKNLLCYSTNNRNQVKSFEIDAIPEMKISEYNKRNKFLKFIKLADSNITDIKFNANRNNYDFEYSNRIINEINQSEGTVNLMNLAPYIIDTLKTGKVFVIDEIDSALHTELAKAIIYMFNSKMINKHGAQLIFSTHNQILMDKNLLRTDQIWFTEKSEDNSTDLYSLISIEDNEFNKRLTSYSKEYFKGVFGAIPYIDISDLEDIF